MAAESFGNEFTLVEVTADDCRKHLWVVLAKPNQAVTLVLTAAPIGWTAGLATRHLTRQQLKALENLHLQPGEVHKLTK